VTDSKEREEHLLVKGKGKGKREKTTLAPTYQYPTVSPSPFADWLVKRKDPVVERQRLRRMKRLSSVFDSAN
jgi:hypothetical protein